ncbi:MAG TPA: Holliday junction resolvase RuvX [Candidatus Krumholzibacteria bacterium]|nr:Holliday junction resolvase RuvX [Candidatus Krumholzibacteria bacterium]
MSGERRRVLGVDPGERRVGLAVSDPLGITAQGLPTFDRTRGDVVEHVRRLVREYDVERIVVGRPLALSGVETESTRRAEVLARELAALGVPVSRWDERLSSVEAQRILAGARAGKDAVDRIAAVLILQGYLDSHHDAPPGTDP